MPTTLERIDAAIIQIEQRNIVPTSEMIDLLLDMRQSLHEMPQEKEEE